MLFRSRLLPIYIGKVPIGGKNLGVSFQLVLRKGHIYTKRMWEEAREALGDCLIGLSKNGWLN